MRTCLVLLMIASAGAAVARPVAPGPRRLGYQTDFDLVTVAVPIDAGPFAADARYLPPALSDTTTLPARRQTPLRIRGKGVRVRLRIPI